MADSSSTSPFASSGSDYKSRSIGVLESIGNTPLLELTNLSAEVAPVKIYAKAEWYNPGGSVKDRPALNMVRDGEARGLLTKDKTLLDSTSGNTGIAYAMICSALGYKCTLCVPKNIGALRQRILEAYGAKLVLTNPTLGSDGAMEEAIRMYKEDGGETYFYPDQYSNPANWQAHYQSTGPELSSQTGGKITHFIAGLGTTGTLCGTGKYLKEQNENIRLTSFQPDSPMHGLEGLKHLPTSLTPDIYMEDMADENRWVRTEDAQAMILRLAKEEGILVGMSSGASVSCALDVARELDEGCVVAMCADNAHKYLDFNFWDVGK